MDLTSGSPFWTVRGDLGEVVPPLDRDLAVDVAIIGGGISGALICDWLVDLGLEVVVLDHRHLGRGSTAASTALLQYEIDTPLYRLREKVSPGHADRAYALGVEAINELVDLAARVGVEARRTPSLYVCDSADRAQDLRREFVTRRSIGLDVSWIDEAAMLARHGIRAFAGIKSTVAACVDPFGLCHALLGGTIRRGALVHDRTSVVRILPGATGVVLHTDRGPVVRAQYAIHASGYEALEWLGKRVASLHSTFAFVSEPLGAGVSSVAERCMVWEFSETYLYARWFEDRLIIGGGDTGFRHSHARGRLVERKSRVLARRARALFPGLSPEPAFSWAGTFASTRDGLAYIGAPKRGGRVLYALGFGGNGITYSVISRKILGDLILGRENPDGAVFAFDR